MHIETLTIRTIFYLNLYMPPESLAQRYKGFSTGNAVYHLYFIVYEIKEIGIVLGVKFQIHGISARGVMTLHDFGNFHQFLGNLAVHPGIFEQYSHIGAGIVTDEPLITPILIKRCIR